MCGFRGSLATADHRAGLNVLRTIAIDLIGMKGNTAVRIRLSATIQAHALASREIDYEHSRVRMRRKICDQRIVRMGVAADFQRGFIERAKKAWRTGTHRRPHLAVHIRRREYGELLR